MAPTFRSVKALMLMLLVALALCSGRPAMAQSWGARDGWSALSALKLAREAEVVLTGRVVQTNKTVRVSVGEVLKGAPVPPQIEITLVGRMDDTGHVYAFAPQQEVMLFLHRVPAWSIDETGWGSIALTPATKAPTVAGVKQLLALPAGDQDATDRAIVSYAASDNLFLRHEAHLLISGGLSGAKRSAPFKTQFLELLAHPDADVRATALDGLRYIQAPEAIPLFIKASRDGDLRVVNAASLTLGHYDTPEAVAALIALTKHPDTEVRIRGMIDLEDSQQDVANRTLVALLDDPNPKVRAMAPRRLIMWIRRGKATDFLPKLIKMLDDPLPEMQLEAAQTLGESQEASALAPLLKVLERPNLSEAMEYRATYALSAICGRIEAPARQVIDEKLGLIIAVLDRGRNNASISAVGLLALSKTPQAVAALQRAAQIHPLEDVREYAARSLPK